MFDPGSSSASRTLDELDDLSLAALWDDVAALVNLETVEEPKCPLCLDDVKVARSLRCGHYFCHHCILRCETADDKHCCPVCLEGGAGSNDLRPVMFLTAAIESFSLVRPRSRVETPPLCDDDSAQFCRFQVLSAPRMLEAVHAWRRQASEAKADLKRFRDDEGLIYCESVDKALDELHAKWTRLLKRSPKFGAARVVGPQQEIVAEGPLRYQRSDGARDFVHPLCVRALLKQGGLPDKIEAPRILQVEHVTAPKLGGLLLPKGTLLPGSGARLLEIDLTELVTPETFSEFSVDIWKREEKRRATAAQGDKHKKKQEKRELELQKERALAREEEERRIRDFFNFSEQQQKELAARARTPSPKQPESPEGSFAAIVSQGGFFPALPPSAHHHKDAQQETFSLQKVGGGAWGGRGGPQQQQQQQQPTFASVLQAGKQQQHHHPTTPAAAAAAAAAATGKPTLLFANNSAARRGSG